MKKIIILGLILGLIVSGIFLENIIDNTVVVNMDETSTLLFPRGMYYFGIVYNGLSIVPIVSSNKVIVEALID